MKKLAAAACAAVLATPALAADVVIGVPNWPSVVATSNILKIAIEENLGLDVELQNGTNPIIFEAMDKGSMDLHPEVWLPNQNNLYQTYVAERGTVVQNPNGVPAFQGMCLPTGIAEANGISSINDLTDPEKAAIFDSDGDGRGEIWIGAPGWASTNVEKVRAKSYGYDQTFELTEFDETLAYANLDSAITAGEPWVGFCYTPHYVFALHDLTVLEEPPYDASQWVMVQPTDDPDWLNKSSVPVAWDTAYLHPHYRKGLEEDHPDVATLFANIALTTDELGDMTYAIAVEKRDAEDYAREWVMANEDRILGWMAE